MVSPFVAGTGTGTVCPTFRCPPGPTGVSIIRSRETWTSCKGSPRKNSVLNFHLQSRVKDADRNRRSVTRPADFLCPASSKGVRETVSFEIRTNFSVAYLSTTNTVSLDAAKQEVHREYKLDRIIPSLVRTEDPRPLRIPSNSLEYLNIITTRLPSKILFRRVQEFNKPTSRTRAARNNFAVVSLLGILPPPLLSIRFSSSDRKKQLSLGPAFVSSRSRNVLTPAPSVGRPQNIRIRSGGIVGRQRVAYAARPSVRHVTINEQMAGSYR